MLSECPGSSKFKKPQPETIKCPSCGSEAEIWTDEVQTICPDCKETIMRPVGQSCVDWCKFAKECVGDAAYKTYMKNKTITLKERLIKDLEDYFGADSKRINHAKKVMGYTEELLKNGQADWHIVIPASILHDVGIKVAEAKYGSSAGNYQEKEGPPVAREMLTKAGFRKEDVDQICEIIAHHHSPGIVNTNNFKALYDADWLVNLKDEVDIKDKERIKAIIDKVFLTTAGKELARKIYIESG